MAVYRMLLCLFVFVSAHVSASELPQVPLMPNQDAPALNEYVRYIKPYDGDINYEAIITEQSNFQTVDTPTINFGVPNGKIFAVLAMKNEGDEAGHWILTTGRGALKNFSMYEVSPSETIELLDGNDVNQIRENLNTFQAFSTEVILAPGQIKTIAFHFESENSTFFPLKIQTYSSFFKARRANIALTASVITGMLVLLLLNSVIYSVTGKNEFLWLGLAELSFAFNVLLAEGYLTIYLLYDMPLVTLALGDVFKCAFAVFMAQFARTFIDTKTNFPFMHKFLGVLIVAGSIVVLMQVGLSVYSEEIKVALRIAAWIVATFVALTLPFVGFFATKRLGYQYFPLIISWSSLALFILYIAFVFSGLVKGLPFHWHWTGPVGLFEAVFATLSLGLHLRKLQTDRKKAQNDLETSLREQLKSSERAKELAQEQAATLATMHDQSSLLHASGHDSQQVLFALNTVLETTAHGDDKGISGQQLGIIKSAAKYLESIISTTMSSWHAATEKFDFLVLSEFKLGELLTTIETIYTPTATGKGIRLSTSVDPDRTMVGDYALLFRAISNLANNALKYTTEGDVSIEADFGADNQVIVTIKDTGSGMSAELIGRLLDPASQRVQGSPSTSGSGVGFGVAANIISNLCGEVAITSEEGRGTCVTVTLPQVGAETDISPSDSGSKGRVGAYLLVDVDGLEEDAAIAMMKQGREKAGKIVVATSNTSSKMRSRLSANADIAILKPIADRVKLHPAFNTP